MSTANPLVVIDFEIAEISGLSDFDDQAELELRRRESDLREARAAVAELIEKADAVIAAKPYVTRQQWAALRAALARVGGAP